MAFPSTNLLLPLLATMTIFLMLLCKVNSSDNYTTFSFPSFDPTNDADKLIFQGDARLSPTNHTLQLTRTGIHGNPLPSSVGRVLYAYPVHLWEKSTGKVSTFKTTFTFVINSTTDQSRGEGLTFFLAPVNSTIPCNSDGGFFGLFRKNTLCQCVDVNDSPSNILAVEFDTHIDDRWDPNYTHIGIDVNTVRSSADISWNRTSWAKITTTVRYNPNNKKLYVTSSSYPNGDKYAFSSSIDLEAVLPEYVNVGFSASTGPSDSAVETHDILSWSFSAWLHCDNPLLTEDDSPAPPPYNYPPHDDE